MTIEQINQATVEELETRIAEIRVEMNAEDTDLDALSAEVDAIEQRHAAIRSQAEQRRNLTRRIAGGEGEVIRTFEAVEGQTMNQEAMYRSAFWKNLAGMELDKEERAAFTHTTVNTGAVLPKETISMIWNMLEKQHAILGDITMYRTGTVIEIVKHTAVTAGAAASVNEGNANTDENNTFVKITLSGKDYSKHVDISYALGMMSVEALEAYVVKEISDQLADAISADVVAKIKESMVVGNKIESAGAKALTFKEVAAAFGKIKRANDVVVYATRATFYNYVVGMVDESKRPIFQQTAQEGANGILLGARVKFEDAVPDNEILIGDPKKVSFNMVQDIMIESDRDIKKHVTTYSGYARGEGDLVDTEAFALLTVKQA